MENDNSVQIPGGTAVSQEGNNKRVVKDTDVPDLSHVFGVDADTGQEQHGKQPHEVWHHFIAAFAHHSNPQKHPHPGKYQGPPLSLPDDWETPSDVQEEKTQQQSEAISNLSSNTAPVIPGPKTSPKPPSATPPPSGANIPSAVQGAPPPGVPKPAVQGPPTAPVKPQTSAPSK